MTLRPAVPVSASAPAVRGRGRGAALVLGLVLLGLLSGCDIPGLTSSGASKPSPSTESGGGSGEAEFFWHQQGQRKASTSAKAPWTPTSTPPVSLPAPAPAASTPSCRARLQADSSAWLDVTPGTGQASVSWNSLEDPNVVEYRVGAVLQTPQTGPMPTPTWTSVAKGEGCQEMSTTVSGLTSGSYYVFWLTAVVNTYGDTRREQMLGRSHAFLVG